MTEHFAENPPVEHNARATEHSEVAPTYTPAWVSGMFEAGGSMFFDIQKKRWSYPKMEITDNNLVRLKKLQALMGGTIKPHMNSHTWMLYGHRAANLAELMKPFSQSRQPTIDRFIRWEPSNTAERLQIALDYRENPKDLEVSAEDYLSLIDNPEFVAGAIDSRGIIYLTEHMSKTGDYGWIKPKLELFSQNEGLLKALANKYGGKVYKIHSEGDKRIIRSNETTLINDSFKWKLDVLGFKTLLSVVGPYLQLNREVAMV